MLPFVWAAGGDGETLDDGGARAAFRFFAALAPYVNPQSATFKEATIAEAMARGEIVLHLNWPFAMSVYEHQGLAPDRIRSAPFPAGPRGRATVLGGGYLGVPRAAPHPVEALALARFLLSRETQLELGRRLGWFSARHDVPLANDTLLAGFCRDATRRALAPGARRLCALEPRSGRKPSVRSSSRRDARDRPARSGTEARDATSETRAYMSESDVADGSSRARHRGKRPWLLLAPLVLYLAVFLAYPMLFAVSSRSPTR